MKAAITITLKEISDAEKAIIRECVDCITNELKLTDNGAMTVKENANVAKYDDEVIRNTIAEIADEADATGAFGLTKTRKEILCYGLLLCGEKRRAEIINACIAKNGKEDFDIQRTAVNTDEKFNNIVSIYHTVMVSWH